MSACPSCGGIIGRDCFNPQECAEITASMASNAISAADYEEVLADHRGLVRRLDVAINGEAGAARQASLCDIVSQVETMAATAYTRGAEEMREAVARLLDDAPGKLVLGNGTYVTLLGHLAAEVRAIQPLPQAPDTTRDAEMLAAEARGREFAARIAECKEVDGSWTWADGPGIAAMIRAPEVGGGERS